jgi:uncharacterized protein YdeI (YjbR/CyaY-like superfamily)
MTTHMRALDRAAQVEFVSREDWRIWLAANHATASGVWLVFPRRGRTPNYEAAVEEALCFGWIDGQADRVDDLRSRQYFALRRTWSMWSAPNKVRFQRMLDAGRVTPAGIAAAERARSNGSWSLLESADRLDIPADLAAALDQSPPARRNWEAYSRSARRQLLVGLLTARREDTRARRIDAIAARARACTKSFSPTARR